MTTDIDHENADSSTGCLTNGVIPPFTRDPTTLMGDKGNAINDNEGKGIDMDSESSSTRLWQRLHAEALEALEEEPELGMLLKRTILAPGVSSLEDAVAMTVCYRLLQAPCSQTTASSMATVPNSTAASSASSPPVFCPNSLFAIFRTALMNEDDLELGHTMSFAVRQDVLAVIDRDPACDSLLEVILFMKGFAALVCHRAARQKWVQSVARGKRKSLTALFLQSQASAVFGMDIHPAATIGAGILLDHGTGVVIGETARIGDGCTLLHAVTLGGTGKEHGDRHPKIGERVFIGAGAKILGNIHVGDGAKIGAGSIVLNSIPAGATAVGAPAKIIGRALEPDPARNRDENLDQVGMLHKSSSIATVASTPPTSEGGESVANLDDLPADLDVSVRDDYDDRDTRTENAGTNIETSHDGSPVHGDKRPSHPHHGSRQQVLQDDDLVPPGCFCPFRDYIHMSLTAPKGTLTILSLQKVMRPQGCTSNEIGSTFFDLDLRNVGYVHWTNEVCELLPASLARNTRLTQDQIKNIVENLKTHFHHHHHHPPSQGRGHEASSTTITRRRPHSLSIP